MLFLLFKIYSWVKTAIAHFMPSTAADIIPPAYPAPSPHGYNPFMFDCLFSFLVICTGDELLVSTPVNIASGCANPFIDLSKYFI